MIPEAPPVEHAKEMGIALTRIALGLGAARGTNLVAPVALQATTRLLPGGSFLAALGGRTPRCCR